MGPAEDVPDSPPAEIEHLCGPAAGETGSAVRVGEQAARRWGLGAPATRLISVSENETFLLCLPDGQRFILRVHRPGYQSRAGIESELAWLDALERDTELAIARPVAGVDGRRLQVLDIGGQPRHAVLFHFVQGREPDPSEGLVGLFGVVGAMAARLHLQVSHWQRPPGFQRPRLDAASILEPSGPWGDWRAAPGLAPVEAVVIQGLAARLAEDLAAYGTAPERFGLIHGDMRLGNLLVDGGRVTLIDFDDSGFGWFGYDFGAAVSFHETHPMLGAWRESWLEHYLAVRPLGAEDIQMLDAMVMLRRMALLAWIGSHADTALARRHADGYAAGTADLAEAYLTRGRIA